MLFSIIIPVYNVEQYLRKCLDSVCAQDCADFEAVVVNDGSTDGSAGIIREYAAKDSRFKMISQENAGLGAARNTGIDAATGEYLLFLDSDDYIHHETLSVLSAYICSSRSDIYVFGYNIVFENKSVAPALWSTFEEPHAEENRRRLMLLNASVCNKAFSCRLFQMSGLRFPVGVRYEDLAITKKLFLLAERVTCCPEYLYFYLQRTGSIMHSVPDYESMRAGCEDLGSFFRINDPEGKYSREIETIIERGMLLILNEAIERNCRVFVYTEKISDFLREQQFDFKGNTYLDEREKRMLGCLLCSSRIVRTLNTAGRTARKIAGRMKRRILR